MYSLFFFHFFGGGGILAVIRGQHMLRNPSKVWKNHVQELRSQGIVDSNIKRTPEWEKANKRAGKSAIRWGYISIAMGLCSLTLIIIASVSPTG